MHAQLAAHRRVPRALVILGFPQSDKSRYVAGTMVDTRSTPLLAGRAVRRGLGLVTLAAAGSFAQNLPVPPLPYSYGSLVPFISEHALRVSVSHSSR